MIYLLWGTALLVVLKLAGFLPWPWWMVLFPAYIMPALALALFVFAIGCGLFYNYTTLKGEKHGGR